LAGLTYGLEFTKRIMRKRVENKVALVTGGSRGMGAGIARRFATEGLEVAFTHSGTNPERAEETMDAIIQQGKRGLALTADNASPSAVTEAVAQTLEQFGRIDVLVNNAGIYLDKPLAEYSLEEFDLLIAVNIRAVFLAIQAAAKHMQSGGRIITIGSNMADRVASPNGTLYAMSKSALIGLNKGVARELGPRGITANLVQPGPVDTDMNPASGAHTSILTGFMALPHYGSVDDVAGLVAYLASEESRFITGAAITIDGGFNI
jgi:3-oxoacyl-[acyl-carrier protein] reductase